MTSQNSENSEYYIQFIAESTTPKAMTLQQIREATQNDPTLQHAAHIIQKNLWHTLDTTTFSKDTVIDIRELKLLRNIKDELTVSNDKNIILRDTGIVIPKSLRADAIRLAHVGHQGIVKTKSLMREKVWFPLIDSLVKSAIDSCIPCQATGRPKPPQPLLMREIPKENFDTVYIDFLGPLPSGETLFVLIDGRSRYPVTKIMKKTDAPHLIPCLDEIFATFGLPKKVISDNGPPFQSKEIKKFMDDNGIQHKTITPLWPQANESETFMKPLMKAIRTAHLQKQNWRRTMQEFLLNYRATPHTTTQVAPATLMFGRNTRTRLPQTDTKTDKNALDHSVEQRDKEQRQRMKEYADRQRQSKTTTMNIGDYILVRQQKHNKFTPNFDPKPLRIITVKGTMITAERPGFAITRNQSFFKPIKTTGLSSEDEEEMEDSDEHEEQRDIGDNENNNNHNRDEQQNLERQYPRRERRRPNYYH
ncbi:PREDICTED: uncharacterized protein K02A2.6-like [Paramuricea clavata]|uniref:PREDICTED: uncharacterized protein K02A2.6-like n=1 Tax=Paramuricea clavata TaxID=317549 RepID=A0A7D9EKS5_PARCT|nr:PREDICTED: uncharacterized protein K02A2.6-like [Paramuricea clavata]